MTSEHRHITENLCLSLLFSVRIWTTFSFTPERKSAENILEKITLALHRGTEGHTHSTQLCIKHIMCTYGCGHVPPPYLGSSTRSGCLWHCSTAVQGQPGTKRQRELPCNRSERNQSYIIPSPLSHPVTKQALCTSTYAQKC